MHVPVFAKTCQSSVCNKFKYSNSTVVYSAEQISTAKIVVCAKATIPIVDVGLNWVLLGWRHGDETTRVEVWE